MAYKSKLQEYCQKKNLPLPSYTTIGEGPSHAPRFFCDLSLGEIEISSPACPSKKLAENVAAELCYKQLVETKKKAALSFDLPRKLLVFLDLENKPNVAKEILDGTHTTNVRFLGYASKEHPTLKKAREIEDYRFEVFEIPSTRNDAADLGIALEVGVLVGLDHKVDFVIVSGDHFAETLSEIVRGMYPKHSCLSCSSTESLLETLSAKSKER